MQKNSYYSYTIIHKIISTDNGIIGIVCGVNLNYLIHNRVYSNYDICRLVSI